MHPTTYLNLQAPPAGSQRLRLVDEPEPSDWTSCQLPVGGSPLLASTGMCRSILLGGADHDRRRELRAELRTTLSANTQFIEASAAWEVLQQAPMSRMVMLTGDLDDIGTDSLTRLLARRHPGLPVLTFEEWTSPTDGSGSPLRPLSSLSGPV
jgi:hypothetical protein